MQSIFFTYTRPFSHGPNLTTSHNFAVLRVVYWQFCAFNRHKVQVVAPPRIVKTTPWLPAWVMHLGPMFHAPHEFRRRVLCCHVATASDPAAALQSCALLSGGHKGLTCLLELSAVDGTCAVRTTPPKVLFLKAGVTRFTTQKCLLNELGVSNRKNSEAYPKCD
jgi:hypothetical protein